MGFNTYGIRSVNRETFNTKYHDTLYMAPLLRNVLITGLRIHNALLNISGYNSRTKFLSGCMRMAAGTTILGGTFLMGSRKAKSGLIIGRWYDEAIGTGIAQIVRGALEALVPYGWVANIALDVIATPLNLNKEFEGSSACDDCMSGGHTRPHKDANYPFPFWLLYVV